MPRRSCSSSGHASSHRCGPPAPSTFPLPPRSFLGRERELFDAATLWLEREPRLLTIVGPGGTGKTRFSIELARFLADEADARHGLRAARPGAGCRARRAAHRSPPRRVRRHRRCDRDPPRRQAGARRPRQPRAAAARCSPADRRAARSRALAPDPRDQPGAAADRRRGRARPAAHGRGRCRDVVPRARAGDPRRHRRLPGRARADPPPRRPPARDRARRRPGEAARPGAAARADRAAPRSPQGGRDADERHATLRATIAWSYDLLDEEEQELFARLAVFRGGATLENAEEVCGADLDTLASLLDKSLVRRRTDADGEERFWMLETIREFARERLDASGEENALRREQCDRLIALADRAGTRAVVERPLPWRFDLVAPEIDNVRAVLEWALDRDPSRGLRLATMLETYWVVRDPVEGAGWLERLLEAAPDAEPTLRAQALRALGGRLRHRRRRRTGRRRCTGRASSCSPRRARSSRRRTCDSGLRRTW